MTKVFGIGWARTGTTTLGACFRILGFNHQSQDLDLVKDVGKGDLRRILALAEKRDSFEDWPWIILYQELDAAFPGSRFVLTTREPDRWIRSYRHMLDNQGKASAKANEQRRVLYGLPFPDVTQDQLLERYSRHNREVVAHFRDRPDALLVVLFQKKNPGCQDADAEVAQSADYFF